MCLMLNPHAPYNELIHSYTRKMSVIFKRINIGRRFLTAEKIWLAYFQIMINSQLLIAEDMDYKIN